MATISLGTSASARSTARAFAIGACLATALWMGVPVFTAPILTQVMGGLDNPRGLAFGPEGALYVVEAGRGGTGPCPVLRGAPQCYGATGAVTRLWRGHQERVAVSLPSTLSPTGEVTGPEDISFQGRGGAYVTVGLGSDPANRALFGDVGPLFGTLVHIPASGNWRVSDDVSAYEGMANPGGGPVDSNPYGVLARPGERIVTDAGANALLRVRANGDISTIAVFPSRAQGRATDSVPTSVALGPDGAYYVSELSGAPFATGAASIYRVLPGAAPSVFLGGFTTVIDLAFGPGGDLYVLEHSSAGPFFAGPGRLTRVAPNGARTVVVATLDHPTAVVVDDDGTIYVSNRGTSIGVGEVLRIEP
jgi:hypothetical protein